MFLSGLVQLTTLVIYIIFWGLLAFTLTPSISKKTEVSHLGRLADDMSEETRCTTHQRAILAAGRVFGFPMSGGL